VSRLEEASKRVFDFVPFVNRVGDDVELHVFGDGPDRSELEARVSGRAIFHGYMPTAQLYRDAYPNLDVLLLFSQTEGSPNAIYEAMQNGVVPVSSRFSGSAAEGILCEGENALLFDVGDTDTAARLVQTLANDRDRLEKISTAARTSIESYTDDDMYAAWIDAIESTPRTGQRPGLRPLPPSGRLERAGLSPAIADFFRKLPGLRFPHPTGWDEWPGSQTASPETFERVRKRLAEIEKGSKR
ncbi:MAG: glycosyltransferase family 4 protein, partial [Thermoanaerobaculia bacterium]